MDGNYQPDHTIKTEPLQPPPQPVVNTNPWHYGAQQQQSSPQSQSKLNDQPKVEPLPPSQAADHMGVSPEKNSYPRSDGARISDRPYRDSRERGRHVSPVYDGERQHRRSRSGSRGKDWNDWSVNGRRSDSAERWPERHRGRRLSRSRSPPAPMRDHLPFRRSRFFSLFLKLINRKTSCNLKHTFCWQTVLFLFFKILNYFWLFFSFEEMTWNVLFYSWHTHKRTFWKVS